MSLRNRGVFQRRGSVAEPNFHSNDARVRTIAVICLLSAVLLSGSVVISDSQQTAPSLGRTGPLAQRPGSTLPPHQEAQPSPIAPTLTDKHEPLKSTGADGTEVGSGALSWIGSIPWSAIATVIGTVITALVTYYVGRRHERDVERLAKSRNQLDASTEERRLDQARAELAQRTDLSKWQIEQEARKIVSDQQVEEARLLATHFDRFISQDTKEQDLALFVMSAFVDARVIEGLAAGRGGVISRSSLSRLAATGSTAAGVAQAALNRGWEEVSNAIAGVRFTSEPAEASEFMTGFYVSSTFIVTGALISKGTELYLSTEAKDAPLLARCVEVDLGHGLAQAQVIDEKPVLPLARRQRSMRIDREQQADVNCSLVQRNRRGQIIVRSGRVAGFGKEIRIYSGNGRSVSQLNDLMELEIFAEPGASGAPLFDDQGFIMGVVVGGTPGSLGRGPSLKCVTFGVDFSILSELLKRAHLEDDIQADEGGTVNSEERQ
jgi:hypothetical protein